MKCGRRRECRANRGESGDYQISTEICGGLIKPRLFAVGSGQTAEAEIVGIYIYIYILPRIRVL